MLVLQDTAWQKWEEEGHSCLEEQGPLLYWEVHTHPEEEDHRHSKEEDHRHSKEEEEGRRYQKKEEEDHREEEYRHLEDHRHWEEDHRYLEEDGNVALVHVLHSQLVGEMHLLSSREEEAQRSRELGREGRPTHRWEAVRPRTLVLVVPP
jgi:hypothetical protein